MRICGASSTHHADRSRAHLGAPFEEAGRGGGDTYALGDMRAPQLDATARASFVARQTRSGPGVAVRLPGGRAEIFLPKGGEFTAYLEALERTEAFADAASTRALESMRGLRSASSPVKRGDAPLVGVVVSDLASLAPSFVDASGSLTSVLRLIESLDAKPLLLPPRLDLVLPGDAEARTTRLRSMVSVLDGVIGLGGDDIAPEVYGEPNTASHFVNAARDRAEIELIRAAMGAPLSMFGICRSHQLWNVARRGKLIQDIEREGYSAYTHDTEVHGLPMGAPLVVPGTDQAAHVHEVVLAADSHAARAAGSTRFVSNARHHQAVRVPGEGLTVTGVVPDPATRRSLIEVTEDWHTLSVQFHPESMAPETAAFRMIAAGTRRAHVFHLKHALEASGQRPTRSRLLEGMRARDGFFEPSDYAWFDRGLGAGPCGPVHEHLPRDARSENAQV